MNSKQLKTCACLFFLFLLRTGIAQTVTCSPKDKQLFSEKIMALKALEAASFGDSLVHIGASFLGTSYVEKTLEIGPIETLVINLTGLDCTTFVENVLAFGLVLRQEDRSLNTFSKELKTIRYRNGALNGYPSRLHYFTDWIRDNEQKGFVMDITAKLNGIPLEKTINFMGTHRNSYPFLQNDRNFERILEMEAVIAAETLCYLPQEEIAAQEAQLQSGDIIALATNIKGLDVTHTGIAVRKENGRIHLLHASTTGSVVVSKEPLTEYLKKIKHNIGIIVARPL